MIETAVFSYFNNIGIENPSGFLSFSDYLYSQTLAVQCAAKHFKKVKIITNDFGYETFKQIGLDKLITEFDLSLNQYDNLEKYFWGFTKIHAYNQQKEPFVHIDNDFYVWEAPEALKHCQFGFQSPEVFDNDFYRYYYDLKIIMENAPYKPQTILDHPLEYAQNCGIVACSQRFDIIEEWFTLAKNYIFENKQHLLTFNPDYRIHLNLLHEQYFIASLLDKHEIKKDKIFYYFSDNNFYHANKAGNKFTHLWGTVKKEPKIMQKVKNRVHLEQPEIGNLIEQLFNTCHKSLI
jgi:hypothetical protein